MLRAFSVWTVYVWVTRIVNILGDDHSAGFKAVHTMLALVSVAFALAILGVASRNRRRAGTRS